MASLDQLCVNTIRTLSIDAVQKANSGHPGMPMGMADVSYILWTKFLKHSPKNPEWFDVIVTDNMFGDIITDLGAMIQGGMGLAAGGNINQDLTGLDDRVRSIHPLRYFAKCVANPRLHPGFPACCHVDCWQCAACTACRQGDKGLNRATPGLVKSSGEWKIRKCADACACGSAEEGWRTAQPSQPWPVPAGSAQRWSPMPKRKCSAG